MKNERQEKIMELIANRDVETQEDLLVALREAGFNTTQATVSRDIKELRIVKELTPFGTYRYAAAATGISGTFSSRINTIFRECVTSYDYAQNLMVIKTLPGLANAAGTAIDAMKMRVVVGTLAGDDTLLIIMRDTTAAAAFYSELRNLLT